MGHSSRLRMLGVIVLIVVAAIPRFYDLNRLSFRGDEPLTAMSARSVLQGKGAAMPTGMPYHRAVAFTWANAGVAAVLGEERELSYRVTAAFFGTLTPAALFLTGTAFVSPPAAFVGSAMLALSQWHVDKSRNGRMYAPFVFFFVLTAFFFWEWAWKGRKLNLLLGLLLFGCTVSLHLLGLFAALFALIPLVLHKQVRPSPLSLLAVGLGAAAIGYALSNHFISTSIAWDLPRGFELDGQVPRTPGAQVAAGSLIPLGVLGALVGAWLWWTVRGLCEVRGLKQGPVLQVTLLAAATVTGAFVGAGHLWGATLAASAFLLMYPHPAWKLPRASWIPLLLLLLGVTAWSLYAVQTMGAYSGIRRLVSFPFPYPGLLWHQSPRFMVLFAFAFLWLLVSPHRKERVGIAGVGLAIILPIAAIGMMRDWGGTRYVFHVYPYMLLAVAAALVHFGHWVASLVFPRWGQVAATALALLVVLSGATGAHGIVPTVRVASVDHGEPLDLYSNSFVFVPDHRSPGQYVRRNLDAGDVVIAEDFKAQFVYVGQVDYWFRRAGDARKFLYLASDGRPRDVYVNSALLSTVSGMEEVVRSAAGRVWLITSGETASRKDWYLSKEQRSWLDSLEATVQPAFVGEDGVTSVYCLNCQPEIPVGKSLTQEALPGQPATR